MTTTVANPGSFFAHGARFPLAVIGDVRATSSSTYWRTVRMGSDALSEYLAWEFGTDPACEIVVPSDHHGDVCYFRSLRDAEAFAQRVRLALTSLRGRAGDHGVFAA